MRAAQKIAYGHASIKHDEQFPGMTKDQLADSIYGKLKRSIENPEGLQLGVTQDGAPIIYDPKDNTLIIRDPNGADCGTVFKPDHGVDYLRRKSAGTIGSFNPGQLADGALPPDTGPRRGPTLRNGEPALPKPPLGAPVEASPVKPTPGAGKGAGPMPGLPFGGGMPADSPATGPHVIHPHKPGQHHRMPLLGELPDDYED